MSLKSRASAIALCSTFGLMACSSQLPAPQVPPACQDDSSSRVLPTAPAKPAPVEAPSAEEVSPQFQQSSIESMPSPSGLSVFVSCDTFFIPKTNKFELWKATGAQKVSPKSLDVSVQDGRVAIADEKGDVVTQGFDDVKGGEKRYSADRTVCRIGDAHDHVIIGTDRVFETFNLKCGDSSARVYEDIRIEQKGHGDMQVCYIDSRLADQCMGVPADASCKITASGKHYPKFGLQ